MASTYLTRSLASTNTSWTFSAWVKRSGISAINYLISWGNSGTDATGINFSASGQLAYYSEASPDNHYRITSAKYRDVNGWYHVVCKCDAGTITLYVNGEEPTQSWSSGSAGQALDTSTMQIGKWVTSAYYFDGSMSHVHFIDGTAYDATAFGSVDNVTGEWSINTSPSVTYGTNGFFILKDGNSLTDQSGNSNNFTVGGGTLTNTEDSPSNVFTTWNPLANFNNTLTFSKGNLTGIANSSSNPWFSARATLGFTSGKWYWETKFTGSTDPVPAYIGVVDESAALNINDAHNANGNTLYYNGSGGEMRVDGSATSNDYGNFSTSDVCGVAVNADDNLITIYKNGSAIVTDYALSTTRTGFLFPTAAATNTSSGTNNNGVITNFGNGYFGTTAVSSAGTNASGIGIFEYDVPTGYTALSTKGLNL